MYYPDKNHYPEDLEVISPETVDLLLGEIDNKVGQLDPNSNGTRYNGFTVNLEGTTMGISVRQIPLGTDSYGGAVAIISTTPSSLTEKRRYYERITYNFYPTPTGAEVKKLLPFDNGGAIAKIRGDNPNDSYQEIDEALKEVERRTRDAEAELGLDVLHELEAQKLLAALRESTSTEHPKYQKNLQKEAVGSNIARRMLKKLIGGSDASGN